MEEKKKVVMSDENKKFFKVAAAGLWTAATVFTAASVFNLAEVFLTLCGLVAIVGSVITTVKVYKNNQ